MNAIYPPMLKQMGKQFLVSLIIFTCLFAVLMLVEWAHPTLKGTLLQWSNPAFIVGIPASIIGVGYTLTIRDARNYLGFYPGIVMSLLLAWQFYLQANYDLCLLYIVVFFPFQILSLVRWRRAVLQPQGIEATMQPSFLHSRLMWIVNMLGVILVILDYIITTRLINNDGFSENVLLKIISGVMIAASCFANFLLIFKKNDAWLCWVFYSIAGIVFYIIIGNVFSIVLFTVFLIINASAQFAWMRNTAVDSFGWAGSRRHIENLQNQHIEILRRQERWLEEQLSKNRERQQQVQSQFKVSQNDQPL